MEWGELSRPIQPQTIDRELTEPLKKKKKEEEEEEGDTSSPSFSLWYQLECTVGNPNKALYLQIQVWAHMYR